MGRGNLFVISGPSGAGKSTICCKVRNILNITLAISATTRHPRDGEINGREYYFLSFKEFENKIKNNEFLEYAKVHQNYYGTLRSDIELRLDRGENIILEIDVQGGIQIKNKFQDACLIFFKAPTEQILEKRLRNRGTEVEDTLKLRLQNSLKELDYESKYDYVIVNETIDQSILDLIKIIQSTNN